MGFHFPGLILIVEHIYVKFGDPSCIELINRQTNGDENLTHAAVIGVGNKIVVITAALWVYCDDVLYKPASTFTL